MSAVEPNMPLTAVFNSAATLGLREPSRSGRTMSPTQSWELLYLAQRAERPDLFADDLDAREADARIARLRLLLDG